MALNSGYFDAQWDSNLEDYDIKYASSDFNRYLRGIINQNGVFKNIRILRSNTESTEESTIPFEIEIGEGLEVYIHSGKAMVNGHWAELTDGQTVSFARDESDLVNHPGPDQTVTRRDGIVLRYDQNNRNITLTNKTGTTSTTGIEPIWPAGYDWENTKDFFGVDENGIAEIMLAWVDIPPNTTQLSSKMITSRIGNSECPWISHLVLNPEDPDVDTYLAMMKDSFDEWFHDTQERLQINTNIVRYYKTVYSQTGSTSTTISLSNMKVVPSFEDAYKIEDSDIITVYYNGLAIIDNTNNKNWTLFDDNGTPKITLNWIPQNSSGQSVIPKGNGVDIVIEKSRLGGIKNCINEYY